MLTEALLGAVAEAVFSYLLEQAGLAEKLRAVLGRDPQRLAFQAALARAYTAFARQYPQWAVSLFDQHFLTHGAAPFLARCLQRDAPPDPAELAAAWADQLGLTGARRQRHIRELTPACTDFLRWLQAELRGRPEFQPLFDSRTLDAIADATAETTQALERLPGELARALEEAAKYRVVVERAQGLVVGDNATVTNVYNTYLSGDFASLDDYYIRPDAVFQRVHADEFVGRDWLTAKVDAFLEDPSRTSGAFLLVGEAGVGKTSFLAHLVRERCYLHVFAEQAPGEANLPRALQSLGAQLVTRYQIEPYRKRDTLTQISVFPDFLDRLLRLTAAGLTAGEKIVIVCDALDEAGVAGGGNVLGLPAVLPDGVYLILSQRPVSVRLDVRYPLHREQLEATGADNLRDVREYLEAVACRPTIAAQLRAQGYAADEFVCVLTAKSGGLWIYLQYVIEEIAQGQRAPLDLERLPSGLAGYYAGYWGDWREGRNGRGEGPAQWDALYAPLLATLAAAQEPVSLQDLTSWSGVDAPPYVVERLLKEAWRAFVTAREQEPGRDPRYRLYHASLRDFLTGRVERTGLTVEGSYLVDELGRRAREAHARIVAYYRDQCGGDWPELARQDYARRHLVTHLAGAEQFDELFSLVAERNRWAEARYAAEESYAGYLTDLEQAWRSVEGEARWDVGRQVRCALIESSIRSLAGNILPELLLQLVETGLWSPARTLAHIPQMPDEEQRARALGAVISQLPDAMRLEALAAARETLDVYQRSIALNGVALHLSDDLRDEAYREALAAVQEIVNEKRRFEALSEIARHLPQALWGKLLAVARGIADEETHAQTLIGILPHLPQPLQGEVLQEALAAARDIADERTYAQALTRILPHLPQPLQGEVLQEALETAREIKNGETSTLTFCMAVLCAPNLLREEALGEVLVAMRGIANEMWRAEALIGIMPYLPQALRAEVLVAIREIRDASWRAEVLSAIVPHLPQTLLVDTLAEAQGIEDEYWRARALSGIVPHLPQTLQVKTLAVAQGIEDERWRAKALSDIAPHLPQTLREKTIQAALAAAREIEGERRRAEALSKIIPYLPQALQKEACKSS